ncbi:hypothetical protein FGB62_86g09 [Gracilaria domingensis]|nr:hypothetical protein FGB62_86g09 [Gracilaria domingensis]
MKISLVALILCFVFVLAQEICPPGSQSGRNQSCELCQPGTFTGISDSFESCRLGTFQPVGGQSSCLPCPTGTDSTFGATNCGSCPDGQALLPNGTCQVCPAGKELLGSDSGSACISCASGFFKAEEGPAVPFALRERHRSWQMGAADDAHRARSSVAPASVVKIAPLEPRRVSRAQLGRYIRRARRTNVSHAATTGSAEADCAAAILVLDAASLEWDPRHVSYARWGRDLLQLLMHVGCAQMTVRTTSFPPDVDRKSRSRSAFRVSVKHYVYICTGCLR